MFRWLRKYFSNLRPDHTNAADGIYSGLRGRALSTKRVETGIPSPPANAPIWGILMETGLPEGSYTLLVLGDGTTSLYLSTGGGVIGGQGHKAVRDANTAFLETANKFRHLLQPTESFPIPETGHILFYALTDSGVLTGSGLEHDLGEQRHPLSKLFHAGHGVITQLRLITNLGE